MDGNLAEVEALVAPPHRLDPQPVVVGRTEVQDEAVLGGVRPVLGLPSIHGRANRPNLWDKFLPGNCDMTHRE